MGLERGFKRLSQENISDLGYLKLHRYNKFNMELLESEKMYAFKGHDNKDHTPPVKGKSTTTSYV